MNHYDLLMNRRLVRNFDPDADFDVEKFRFWDSSYRKTAGKYVGMTVWVSGIEHLPAFREIVNQIPNKV